MYRLLSLDQSTRCTGYCVFDDGEIISHGVINTSKDKSTDTRIVAMSMRIRDLLANWCPDHIVIEETVYQMSPTTLRLLAQLQGMIMGICQGMNISYSVIMPSEWRKELKFKQGKGTKREVLKQQSIDYVAGKYGVKVTDDESDAICIGDAYILKYGKDN